MAVISLLLMSWSSAVLAAEVRVSQLPEDASFVQATEGGELWAVTDKPWRINPEGSAQVVSTPMRVERIAWAGSKVGLWIASPTGAALLEPSGVYQVSPEGHSEAVVSKTSVGGSLPTTPDSVAKDLSGHGLLMVRFEEPDKLMLAHWENGELHTERIPLPHRIAKEDPVVSTRGVAASGDVTWVLLNGALAMKRNGAWTVFSSARLGAAEEPLPPGPAGTEMSETTEARAARKATLTTVGWAVVGGSLSLGIGTFSGSAVRGERGWATGAQTLAGSLLGTLPGLAALRYSPLTSQWGPGMGGALAMASSVGGFTLQLGATTLGTWATGELGLSPTQNPWASLGGALLGSLVGAALGLGVDALLQKVFPNNEALRWSFAIGLVGSGATVGYQWLGGGPRNGP